MTILEALSWGERQLKETLHEKETTGHNQKLDAQVLLSYTLKKPASYLFSHFEDEVPAPILETYIRYIERRKRHEPVAYITGQKEFFSRPFYVNPSVLIPRPETEHLITEALQKISENSTIIDIGTGSGAIAVTLAAETHQPIIAIDVSPQALSVAKKNATSHDVSGKIAFYTGDLLTPYIEKNITSNSPHGVLLANLPYLRLGQWEFIDPDVKHYEPKIALVGGVDGLDYYDQLFQQIKKERLKLPKSLDILMEMDPSQELSLPRLIKDYFKDASIEVLYDLSNKARITSATIKHA